MNAYFQFKQFTIQQNNCAMKVCTDACLFGAWVANILTTKKTGEKNILDIGCGTGLLSLMIAQKNTAEIDAIEIDEPAYLQATSNISTTPFANQIKTHFSSIELFTSNNNYDFIICNPPFYENQLKANTTNKNVAMHEEGLTAIPLLYAIKKHLKKDGKAAILIPYYRLNYFIEKIAENNLYINHQLNVKQTPKHDFFRVMLVISFNKTEKLIEEIFIKLDNNNYSEFFKLLLKDYYLHL